VCVYIYIYICLKKCAPGVKYLDIYIPDDIN